jgi:diacylglycerol O-acyltransferase / wax synthase
MPSSAPELLSVEDARILALEEGPVRGHTCKLVLLDGVRGVDELREHVASRLDREHRLGVRLVEGDAPAWEPDPAVEIERQVRDAGAVDEAGLPETVGTLMAERLPRDRPLWALDVVAIEGGRTALVWRIHHALADGSTAMRMARRVLFDDTGDDETSAAAGGPAASPTVTADSPARSGVGAGDGAVEAHGTGHSRLAPLRSALHVPAALRRELARRGAETALDAEIGERRSVAFVDVELDAVKRIAHALPERATVNDVVLTAVAGGLRAVAAETRERKRDHDAQTLDAFFRDLSHMSSSLERFAEHWAESPRVFTLNVSNVPGPRGPLSVLGAPVASMHSLAEIGHRHALRVAVVSANGRIGFGFCTDADAIGSPQPIADGVAAELRVLAAALG